MTVLVPENRVAGHMNHPAALFRVHFIERVNGRAFPILDQREVPPAFLELGRDSSRHSRVEPVTHADAQVPFSPHEVAVARRRNLEGIQRCSVPLSPTANQAKLLQEIALLGVEQLKAALSAFADGSHVHSIYLARRVSVRDRPL